MAIIATSKNYTGRKVDLSLYPEIAVSGVPVEGKISPSSRAIAGPSKVAQNFVRILLTPLGKYRAHPKLGSDFMLRLRQGFVRFDVDLLHLFTGEALGVVEFMEAQTTIDTPLDERIAAVELVEYSVIQGSVRLRARLTTQAGDNTTFLLPVSWGN